MPECIVCGQVDFEETDGMYFCTNCQTQTQEMVLEDTEFVDEEGLDGNLRQMDVRLRIQDRKETSRKTKVPENKGRPWTTYEAYEIVLKHQVEALVNLGANPKLKDFVFRLWALYLSKLGTAFIDDEKLYPDAFKNCPRTRDKYFGNVKDPTTAGRRNARVKKRKLKVAANEAKDALKTGDENYVYMEDEDDGPRSDSSSSDSESGEFSAAYRDKVEWCHLHKIISLCYLGLMYTNCTVTASDIVRWLEQGLIPYTELTSILPEDIKLSSYDVNLFTASIPRPKYLRFYAGNLAHFLDIGQMPPVSMSELVSRFVLMLDLPGEFHKLVMNVISQHSPQLRFEISSGGKGATLPSYDTLAMAYILFSVKLWFGLNDKIERQLSNYTKDIIQLVDGQHDLFVFDEWQERISASTHLNDPPSIYGPGDISDCKDVDGIVENYFKTHNHQRLTSKTRYNYTVGDYNRYHQATKEDLATPFKVAFSKMTQDDEVQGSQVNDDDQEGALPQDVRKYAYSRMKHITMPDDFFTDFNQQHLTDSAINSSSADSDKEDDDPPMMFIEDPTDCELPLTKIQSPGSASRKAIVNLVTGTRKTATLPSDIETEIERVRSEHIYACFQFVIYRKVRKDDLQSLFIHRHKSYLWLLKLCSKIVRCSMYELDLFLLHLSVRYFQFDYKQFNLKMSDIKSFHNKYFKDKS